VRRYAATLAVLAVFVGGHVATARDDPKPDTKAEAAKLVAPVKIVGETKLPPYKIVRLKAENVPVKFGLRWRVKATDPKNQELIDWATGDRVQKPEWVAPPGSYTVELTVGGTDKDGQFVLDGDEVVVTIGKPTPGPGPPDVDPDVKPPPPTPSVAPIAKPGLRVLIVRESDANDQTALTAGQREVIRPGKVWDYLRAKTVTEAENPGGAWRILDPQVNPLTNGDPDGKTWAEAMKRPRASIPWVVISNGTKNTGYEGPLPSDITGAKFIDLLKQYE
jgi:hypothetical protein